MERAYRDNADSLRARADALELENVVLKARLRRVDAMQGRQARRNGTGWLTGALLVIVLLAFGGVAFGSCLSILGSALGGIQ